MIRTAHHQALLMLLPLERGGCRVWQDAIVGWQEDTGAVGGNLRYVQSFGSKTQFEAESRLEA